MTEEKRDFSWLQEGFHPQDKTILDNAEAPHEPQPEPAFGENELLWMDRTIKLRHAGFTQEQTELIRQIVEAPVELTQDKPQDPTL